MRRTRGLWLSIAFVLVLVAGSVALFLTGTGPVLGLDLEGGVSVTLSAPPGTPEPVMDRAVESIRRRVDAFGTSEPTIFVSGSTIEVQIPGLARGTTEERPAPPSERYCLVGAGDISYGCFPDQVAAETALAEVQVGSVTRSVCLTGLGTEDGPCFATQKQAQAAIDALEVTPAGQVSPAPSPSPSPAAGTFCVTGPDLGSPVCDLGSKEEAQALIDAVGTTASVQYCLQGADGSTLTGDDGPACFADQQEADDALAGIDVQQVSVRHCVVSSAGKGLGCYLTQDKAEARLQETGQERLLQVIGTTARLEEREVLGVLAPTDASYDATPVTCATETERATPECAPKALEDQDVVYLGQDGKTKYQLGPVRISGDAIRRATALYDTGSQSSVGQGWQIDFELTDAGSDRFAQATTELVGRQLAIVLDREVMSAPTVQEPITGGRGVITGSFTETRAKDLATVLNAGALPVTLTTEQVVTVSPTLGEESLKEGLIAGVAGLILLALYLLFYYRLLAVVAWMGMTIWAVLALALISIAGRTIGYTLTLAGVAGLIISLGVTADSYIVFFERLKDEVRNGRSPRAAVQPAFKRAYKTIVAADVVTALAAIVLYVTAISSVRGFALTLGVATVLDLFVVYFFKRPTVFLIARSERLVSLRGFGLASGVAAEDHAPEPAIAGGAR
ncbi:MAG TPA: protein translocase subunit SecD [Actinomycetota bacterium]|nr:protein translocase subunit SecD [Actinomycetota bacterium]